MYNYSDSEESDNPFRPRSPPFGFDPKEHKKPILKPSSPQDAINTLWKRFSVRNPAKVASVFPFDPVLPPAANEERVNEPVDASYERAKEECTRRVEKIIQECKRINTRYRDLGFDISWDLQRSIGNTLNSLGSDTFKVSSEARRNHAIRGPKAVKRISEIFQNPTFLKKISIDQAKQGALGDCWAISALTGLACVEDAVKRLCVCYDTRIGIYGFVFHRDGKWIYSIVDDRLFLTSPVWDAPSMQRDLLEQIDNNIDVEDKYNQTYHTGSKALFFASNADNNETWVPLLEKAYAKAHGDYESLDGGWIGEALEDMTGGVTTELLTGDILDTDSFWENELSRVNKDFLFGCSTGFTDGGGTGERNGIVEGHAYVVTETRVLKSGVRLVKLRNPWGTTRAGLWHGPWSDGSKEWTAEMQQEIGHTFGTDSSFWISYDDFLRKWQQIDRTRLFRDPGWYCSQHWISVDVPWKAHYHERFRFELTKNSPVVLVLSQLDYRYFRGLEGMYRFSLHFRLHKVDDPSAENYIFRSHATHLLCRSVSIDIPELEKGRYSVWVMVKGDRIPNAKSVEKVISYECSNRLSNRKLEQVGLAYDLAHSRAAAYMAEAARAKKMLKGKKASECRAKELRKSWERRSKLREISRKQQEKNKLKMEQRKKLALEKAKKDAPEDEDSASSSSEMKRSKKKSAGPSKTKHCRHCRFYKSKQAEKLGESDSERSKTCNVEKAEKESSGRAKTARAPQDSGVAEEAQHEAKNAKETSGSEDAKPTKSSKGSSRRKGAASPKANANPAVSIPSESESSSKSTDTDTESETDQQSKKARKYCRCAKTSSKSPTSQPPCEESKTGEAKVEESSDSPISDWDELYSSSDYTRRPRANPASKIPRSFFEVPEDPKTPEPWNAICIVGFRVYSKDRRLSMGVVIPNGEEWGWARGECDLDNAQMNAGGERIAGTDKEEEVVKVVKIDTDVKEIDAIDMRRRGSQDSEESLSDKPAESPSKSPEERPANDTPAKDLPAPQLIAQGEGEDGDDEGDRDENCSESERSREKHKSTPTKRSESESSTDDGVLTPTSDQSAT
ncbi:Calpain clp-1 [Ceratocystis fimbriata CBS 114723]|uniref:Calpain clp-1 n=1 Tax=Ceratocystis fimbriata CBS 114723 TaxID=1035309 RepID=A0A2C5XEM5_9PEZI|nr:Calpain clp-1 [Ceratocystis fimbriata CBS 114723]